MVALSKFRRVIELRFVVDSGARPERTVRPNSAEWAACNGNRRRATRAVVVEGRNLKAPPQLITAQRVQCVPLVVARDRPLIRGFVKITPLTEPPRRRPFPLSRKL